MCHGRAWPVAQNKADTMEPSTWPPEHSGALCNYFAKGMSFSEIARRINARFGTTYTRNAVLGRARRMGLGVLPPPACPPLAPSLPGSPGSTRPWPQPLPVRPPKSAFVPAKPVKLRCVGIRPRLISLLELGPEDCRYPYGGDKEGEDISFCGHPRCSGSSYCAPHRRLTTGPDTAPRPAARPVVLRLVA